MRIQVLPAPEGDIVAREYQSGEPEGEFFVGDGGTVKYRSIWEERVYPANRDSDQLRASVAAYDRYLTAEAKHKLSDDVSQLAKRFRRDLEGLGVDLTPDESFWSYIVEQVEDGLL
jgi:hypothetical protein